MTNKTNKTNMTIATISTTGDGETITAEMPCQPSETLIRETIKAADGLTGKTVKATKPVRTVLRQYIARIERVEAELADLRADRTEIYKEVKAFGLDVPTVRRIIKLRKMEEAERQERDALTDLYMDALDERDKDGQPVEIPLPGQPKTEATRKASKARLKKEAARDALLKAEKQARTAARARAKTLLETTK